MRRDPDFFSTTCMELTQLVASATGLIMFCDIMCSSSSLRRSVNAYEDDAANARHIFVTLSLRDNPDISFKLDTGADVNTLSVKDYHSLLVKPELQPQQSTLHGYGGNPLSTLGQCTLECSYKSSSKRLTFCVVDTLSPSVINFTTCAQLGIMKMSEDTDRDPSLIQFVMAVSTAASVQPTCEVQKEFPDL